MMNISALRHNAENNDPSSSESEEGEDSTPWPEHVHEKTLPHSPHATPAQDQWAKLQWSNRNGKYASRDLPKDQQYPINIFGRSAGQAFADSPEPKKDLSSGEDDDFAARFPDTRPRRPRSSASHYAVSNERHTQNDSQLYPTSSRLTLRPIFQNPLYSHAYNYAGSNSSRGVATLLESSGPGLPRISTGSYTDEETGRRGGKQLFDETVVKQYLNTPVMSSSLPGASPGKISAKAKGKQRSYEDADDFIVPNMQMSGLRLGVDQRPQNVTRTSPRLQLKDDERRNAHSRNSTSESVYLEEDNDDDEFDGTEIRWKKPTSHASFIGSRSRAAASRSGKRPVTSEEEDEHPLSQSMDTLPSPIASPVKPSSGKKRKVNRYPCPVPLCRETFTRRNDVRRHIKNAAVHRDSPEALALLGEAVSAGTRCKYCNADLSRSDARMRHERASACGKRTTQKMKDQMIMRI